MKKAPIALQIQPPKKDWLITEDDPYLFAKERELLNARRGGLAARSYTNNFIIELAYALST